MIRKTEEKRGVTRQVWKSATPALSNIEIAGTTAGIIGALFVALGKPLAANVIWLLSNPVLMYHNYRIGQLSQSRMFFVFTVISIFGVVNLW